jgi:Zn-dependent M28 family amino/carboxypeptidase
MKRAPANEVSAARASASEPRTAEPSEAPAQAIPPQPKAKAESPALFDSARAWQHLQKQVALGPRPSGTPALVQNRTYIVDQLKAIGIESREQAFIGTTPLGEVSMANVIATIPGKRPDRIAIASHFDTKLFREIRFVGANDGASSTAALLELARVLKAQPHEFTIELLFFDGEEARMTEWRGLDNTYGSRRYVEDAVKSGSIRTLKALILLDMIGDKNLNIRRDSNSTPWLVDIIWGAAARLGHTGEFPNELTTVEDDHIPFVRAGVPVVDVIDLDNPTWHTAQDNLENVSAKSLQVVGDVIAAAFPEIEKRLAATR